MMRLLLSFLLLTAATAFTPTATHSVTRTSSPAARTSVIMKEGLGIDPERKRLTRENEPGERVWFDCNSAGVCYSVLCGIMVALFLCQYLHPSHYTPKFLDTSTQMNIL